MEDQPVMGRGRDDPEFGDRQGGFFYWERARTRDRHEGMRDDEVKTLFPLVETGLALFYFFEVKQGYQVILPRKPEDLKSEADKIRWSRGSPAPHLTFSSPCRSALSACRLPASRIADPGRWVRPVRSKGPQESACLWDRLVQPALSPIATMGGFYFCVSWEIPGRTRTVEIDEDG